MCGAPLMSTSLVRDADFRRLWSAGLIISLVRWLEILVFGVFTYQQTDSAFYVAGMTMLRLLPLALFGVPFGALAARVRREAGLAVMLTTLSVTAMALLGLAAMDRIEVWHLGLASFINGTAWAADNPLRRALIGDIAGPARMGNAMALDVGASNASRLAGPGLGGVLLASFGMIGPCLLVAALYLVAFVAVLRLSRRPVPLILSKPTLGETLAAGFLAARDSPRLAAALWITILFNLFGWPVLSMVPVIGQDRLGLAADGIGLLASMDGVGSLLGAVTLAALSRPSLYGRIYVCGMVTFLLAIPLFAMSTHPLAAAAGLLIAGIGQAAFSIMQSTIVFIAAPVERRMQAMGLLTMCIGIGPVGFLMLGWLAEWVGASYASLGCACAGLVAFAASRRWWWACWRIEPRG